MADVEPGSPLRSIPPGFASLHAKSRRHTRPTRCNTTSPTLTAPSHDGRSVTAHGPPWKTMDIGTSPQHHGGSEMGVKKDDGQRAHKRNVSGAIMGSLPFLRASTDTLRQSEQGQQGQQGRGKRKSLRKGIFSKNMKPQPSQHPSAPANQPAIHTHLISPGQETSPPHFSYENATLDSSSDSGFSQPTPQVLSSAIASGPYASTTDDDEGLSFFRPSHSSSGSLYSALPLESQSPTMSLQRRRSNHSGQHTAPTAAQLAAHLAVEDEWDYSETEWWGWVILAGTWAVFVVGMGSCLGVWSWAWDVGETPYAPPELEDDPTLPITGYYPALIVCTAVMAWVWVVVAWVGMKYFRHAKVMADDG